MKTSIKHRTSYTLEIDDYEFPIPFECSEYPDPFLFVSPDGLQAMVGVLAMDESPEDPFEISEEGEFFQFNNRSIHYTKRPDIEEWKRLIRANPGRIVTHTGTGDNHGPGTSNCLPREVLTAKDCREDKRTGENSNAEDELESCDGYWIAPADIKLDQVYDYAKGALKTYTSWCNGDVYGICVWEYVNAGTDEVPDFELVDRSEECWGFYGYDYAKEELKSQFDYACAHLDDARKAA